MTRTNRSKRLAPPKIRPLPETVAERVHDTCYNFALDAEGDSRLQSHNDALGER